MNEQLAQMIKQKRQQKRLSRKELAKLFGVYEITISDWENGNSTPSYKDILKFAILFDIPLSDLPSYFDV